MKFTGSICALATPFSKNGMLDLGAFAHLIDYQLAGATQGVVVAGSTGESQALEEKEYDRLLACAVECVAKRVPVIAGTGRASTWQTVQLTQRAKALGADAALVVTPYYARPNQEGLVRHYTEVADQSDLPIILYNVPGRTGCDLLPESVSRLCQHAAIVAIKEAVTDSWRMQQLLKLQDDSFAVLSGDDATCLRAMLAGASGVISVAANIVPKQFHQLCEFGRAHKTVEAEALNATMAELYALLAIEPNPIPVKFCLHLLGLCEPKLRLPLTLLTTNQQEQARQVMRPFITAAVAPHSSAA